MSECKNCGGQGFYQDHAPANEHREDGSCIECPVQVQCEICKGTGVVSGASVRQEEASNGP